MTANKYLNPMAVSIAALRGKFRGGAGLEKRSVNEGINSPYIVPSS